MKRHGKNAILMALLFALTLTGCSTALNLLQPADVQRGLEIATAANDQAGIGCAQAVLKHLGTRVPAPQPVGPFSLFMDARELRRGNDKGVDEEVHNACAVLLYDAQTTLGKLGLKGLPGGGIASDLVK